MKFTSFLFVLLILCLFNCQSSTSQRRPETNADSSVYGKQTASYDGIGKTYFGREIAHVMGFGGASWLERDERQEEENTALAIQKMPISANSVVADIGAGTGYYAFRIAAAVPQGKVIAVDVQQESVDFMKNKALQEGYKNVEVVPGGEKSPNLPDNSVDLALMVDVYHELEFPHEMLQAIRRALKPDGKLLLLEYRTEDPSIPIKKLHKLSVAQANKELEANGFRLVQKGDFLPIQHFLVYQKQP
ncbi:class I SAM-dependent methyltransferase [Arundinibacter roseus]|uniref:Class I SAM-dependent methyltransferase n=1 Tax=Arundinibacter roseus TaxID=2070510 RepID=A0A4R4K3Y6_9BACT|nr:class I SAM-dependent methyltransferase [Arundinibacter roseus]TDB61161.1 class I SAM-dependent methyltransferase [Arundinibacter roseus]